MKRNFLLSNKNSKKIEIYISSKISFQIINKREYMNKEEVIKIVNEKDFYKVTFIKQNGDIRDMLFTISKAVMEKHGILPQGKRSYNDNNALRVIEITADGKAQWRSFCYSSVISLEKVE